MTDRNTATAFWVRAAGRGELREEPIAAPGSGEVAVRTLYSGVSRGTEALVFHGRVPESQHEAMRAPFQVGDFPGPVKYGYMAVGRVEAVGAGVDESRLGTTVFALHPHQDRFVIPGESAVEVPASVPPGRAVLSANLETAVTASWDARVSTGDRVLVFGAGVVGLLTAWLLQRVPGAEVTVVDPNGRRASAAEALGVPFSEGVPAGTVDVAVDASGAPTAVPEALSRLGVEGRLVVVSWFGDRAVPVPLGEAFHSRRLVIRSSQVGRIPPERAPRWGYARRSRLVQRLLEDPVLDGLIDEESDFAELPETMRRLAAPGADVLCHRIRYPAASD